VLPLAFRIALLPGHLPLRVIGRIHDSESRTAVKKAEQETPWEQSYRSIYRFIGVVI